MDTPDSLEQRAEQAAVNFLRALNAIRVETPDVDREIATALKTHCFAKPERLEIIKAISIRLRPSGGDPSAESKASPPDSYGVKRLKDSRIFEIFDLIIARSEMLQEIYNGFPAGSTPPENARRPFWRRMLYTIPKGTWLQNRFQSDIIALTSQLTLTDMRALLISHCTTGEIGQLARIKRNWFDCSDPETHQELTALIAKIESTPFLPILETLPQDRTSSRAVQLTQDRLAMRNTSKSAFEEADEEAAATGLPLFRRN